MRASESPFQSYKSKRILSFANLICSSVSGPKARKTRLRFAILGYSEKLWKVFEIVWEKCEVFVQKSLSSKTCLKRKKISQTCFGCLDVNLPTVKIWGQSDNFSSLVSASSEKIDSRKPAALNMSVRRVIFTSGQNVKPPFL